MKFVGDFKDLKKLGFQFLASGPACWVSKAIPGDYRIWIFKKERQVIIDDASQHSDAYARYILDYTFHHRPEYNAIADSGSHCKVAFNTKTGEFENYRHERHSWPFVAMEKGLPPDSPERKELLGHYMMFHFNDEFQQQLQRLFDDGMVEFEDEYDICECGRPPEDCATFDDPDADHGDR